MHWKFTSCKTTTIVMLAAIINFSALAGPSFSLKKELVGTAFFPAHGERNPLKGLYRARLVYGDTVSYYVDANSESFIIDHKNQSYLFESTDLLERAFLRWAHSGITFNRVYRRNEADFLFYQTTSNDLANAIAYPTGYFSEGSFSPQGTLQIYTNQIANTLNNLNNVDLSHIHFNSQRELIESLLTFVFIHELGHVIGFAHPTRYSDLCEGLLTNQAPIMSNVQDYFRIQFHLNGDIPVHQQQITPSEREIRDFVRVNSHISPTKRHVLGITDEFCDLSKRDFILKIAPVLD